MNYRFALQESLPKQLNRSFSNRRKNSLIVQKTEVVPGHAPPSLTIMRWSTSAGEELLQERLNPATLSCLCTMIPWKLRRGLKHSSMTSAASCQLLEEIWVFWWDFLVYRLFLELSSVWLTNKPFWRHHWITIFIHHQYICSHTL